MDFLVYLQQLAKLSDKQVTALEQSNVAKPADLQTWTTDDLDDLLQGADPEHFISSRNKAKLERVHEYIRQKHKLVPGKTHFSHVLDMVGDGASSEFLFDDDDESSSVLCDYSELALSEVFPTTNNNNQRSKDLKRQQSTQSIGWGYASTTAGSDLNYQPDEEPPRKSKRGGRRTRGGTKQQQQASAKYSSGDLEACDTECNDSAASSFKQHGSLDQENDFWENHPFAVYAAGCLAVTTGLGVGAGLAIALT